MGGLVAVIRVFSVPLPVLRRVVAVSALLPSWWVDPVAVRAVAGVRRAATSQAKLYRHRCTQGGNQGPDDSTKGENNHNALHGKGLSN